MHDAPAWLVVVARPSADHIAERTLKASGWRVFVPRYRRVLRGHGRKGWSRSGEIVQRSLFGQYIFAEVHPDQTWAPIRRAIGVDRILTVASRPAFVDQATIEELREVVDSGAFDEVNQHGTRMDLRRMLDAGERPIVRYNGSGFVGRLIHLDERGRASLLIEMLGRVNRIQVDAEPLELIAS
jgi:transcription antitermination factor NusG